MDRAACVCLDGDSVLVMRRHEHGRDYTTLPGGGVESTEDAASAAVRELAEETGLQGRLIRHLTSIDHPDRTAHYFLLEVSAGTMRVGGPEAQRASAVNTYIPAWVALAALDDEPLEPSDVRGVIRDAVAVSDVMAEARSTRLLPRRPADDHD